MQNFLRLCLGQTVQAVLTQTEFFFQRLGAVVVGIDCRAIFAGAGQHLAHQLAVPGAVHQLGLGHRWRGGVADDGDEVVNIG